MNGIIILSSGSSSRLGRPKQLLAYRGKTLLNRVVDEAKQSAIGPVWVAPEEGMASSIRKGLSAILTAHPNLDAVILAACDQPFVSASIFREINAHKRETDKGIIVSTYKDTAGTPVLFDKKYFPQLMELEGQQGAKKLIALYPEDVTSISFDLGEIEIDRPEDYFSLQ
jgi:molybdenum cofactor cytidylyltransferase